MQENMQFKMTFAHIFVALLTFMEFIHFPNKQFSDRIER